MNEPHESKGVYSPIGGNNHRVNQPVSGLVFNFGREILKKSYYENCFYLDVIVPCFRARQLFKPGPSGMNHFAGQQDQSPC